MPRSSAIPSGINFVGAGQSAPRPVVVPDRVEMKLVAPDAQGDAQVHIVVNGVSQYIMYLSDRKGRKDPANPGLRINLRPIGTSAKAVRRQTVGANKYIEVNYLTPAGKSVKTSTYTR